MQGAASERPKLSPTEFFNLANRGEEGLMEAFDYYTTVVLPDMKQTRNYGDPNVSSAKLHQYSGLLSLSHLHD